VLFIAILLLTLQCVAAEPTEHTTTLYPVADSFISQAAPDTNFGDRTSIRVLNDDAGYLQRGFIKFDLSSLGDVYTVYDATLYLYKYDQVRWQSGEAVDVWRLDASWDEYTITWNNHPSYVEAVASTPDPDVSGGGTWVSWNLTSIVEDTAKGTYPNYGWALLPNPLSETGGFCAPIYYSREVDNSSMPYLVVHYYGEIPDAPSANFSYSPSTVYVGMEVQFTDNSTGANLTWLWDFGDGYTSTEQNPTHTYSTNGTYNVSLTVSNEYGSSTAHAEIEVLPRQNLPDFWGSWMMVFGSSLVAALAIIGVLAFMCMASGMGLAASIVVMLPTLWGIAESEYFPPWFKAAIIIPIGMLWGLALLRTMRGV